MRLALLLVAAAALAGCGIFDKTIPAHQRPVRVYTQCKLEDGVRVCRAYDGRGQRRYDCERPWSRCKG